MINDVLVLGATINGLTNPVILGEFTMRRNPHEIKQLIYRIFSDYINPNAILPLPSLPTLESLESVTTNKGIIDICLELFNVLNIEPESGQWGNFENNTYYFLWAISEFLATNGYIKKPRLIAKKEESLNPLPHLKVRYHCPFGCYHSMNVNLIVDSNEVKSQLYFLWLLDHFKNFHKINLSLLDNFLAIGSIPNIFMVLPDEKGKKEYIPPVKYLELSSCPKCNGIHNAMIDSDVIICQNKDCTHIGKLKEFKS